MTGRLEVAGGDRDVDLRRQEAAPRRPIGWPAIAGGSRQSPGDRALCLVDLATRQLEERKPGLRVVTVVVGALERLARRIQVAHPEAYLADEIVRVPDPEHQAKSLELLTCLTGLLLGFRPLTSKHLQLGAMNSAHTRIPTHRLSAHPSLGLVGPLRGTLEVSDVPARRHRVAEDLACVEEAKLAGRGGRRRLVDQRQARSPIPEATSAMPLNAIAENSASALPCRRATSIARSAISIACVRCVAISSPNAR